MITFVLSPDVLGQTRFSFSPLAEATLSLRLLGQPRLSHVHAAWLRHVRDGLDGVDLDLLLPLVPPGRRLLLLVPRPAPGDQRRG